MDKLIEISGDTLIAIFMIVYAFGGIVGAIIAAVHTDLLNVVLCIFIPIYGVIYSVIKILS